jgi:hypothetical protein
LSREFIIALFNKLNLEDSKVETNTIVEQFYYLKWPMNNLFFFCRSSNRGTDPINVQLYDLKTFLVDLSDAYQRVQSIQLDSIIPDQIEWRWGWEILSIISI